MFKFLIIILALLLGKDMAAQNESPAYRKVIDQLQAHYNRGKYDSIFLMFSPEMKTALPLKKTRDFFSGLRKGSGLMAKSAFENFKETYASYFTQFERYPMSVHISVDRALKVNGLFIQPYVEGAFPVMERNTTTMKLPFTGLWSVLWGGNTKELNYHVEVPVQKGAFDFVVRDSTGKAYLNNGWNNTDYYAFGKEIIAPCDGEIVLVVDGIKDNIPGQTNPMFVTGNTVVMRTDKNEFLWFAHFKKHSIKVKEGQKVGTGTLLGLCGNSGNSTEPHLHFHIQNIEDINSGTGVKCFFEELLVNGIPKKNYSPVKDDRVKNTGR